MRGRRNAVASVVTALIGICASLLSTPLILAHIGRSGYGVWTVSMALVIYVALIEGGMAPVVQRFVAAARGAGDHRGALRVFWTTLFFYAVLGLLLAGAVELLASPLVSLMGIEAHLREQAVALLRVVGFVMPLSLLVGAFSNVLQGFERFIAITVTSAAGSLAFIAALVVLTGSDVALSDLGWAVVIQQSVLLLLRLALVLDMIFTRPAFVSRSDARAMAAMSGRLQLVTASLIVNGQSDRVVSGFVAPSATVAHVGIAAQLAEAGRLVAAAPLVPVTNRLAALHGSRQLQRMRDSFAAADRLWTTAVLGATVIGAACAAPLIHGWLGAGYGTAGVLASMLVTAYGMNLMLGVRTAYLRALARPGLESKASIVLMALNVALTVPLALAAGVWGVVGGTLIAYVLGTLWFLRRFAAVADGAQAATLRELARPVALAFLLAVIAAACGWACALSIPAGFALPVVAAVLGLSWVVYLALAFRVPLRPASLRALLTGLRDGY